MCAPAGSTYQAAQTASGGFRLAVHGQPAYAVYPFGIRRLVSAATGSWAAPCALTVADLRRVSSALEDGGTALEDGGTARHAGAG
ncbi:MAG: hypothetical protein NVS2B4_20760 [Ramlibacter sp.]